MSAPAPARLAAPVTTSSVGLRATSLHGGYGSLNVVRALDIEVAKGEVVALLGPNGAGKTTTVMTLAGALPAQSGAITMNGVALSSPLHRRARNGLGLVTEQRGVIVGLTLRQNLRLANCDENVAFELFPELYDHRDRKVGSLSGGQQQMLALSRALGRDPAVLLIDELSLGLAPLVVDRLLLAVRAAADGGVAVLVVEQHVAKVLNVADRFLVLRRGQIALQGRAVDYQLRVQEIFNCYLDDVPEKKI